MVVKDPLGDDKLAASLETAAVSAKIKFNLKALIEV